MAKNVAALKWLSITNENSLITKDVDDEEDAFLYDVVQDSITLGLSWWF